MTYISTRGEALSLTFEDVLLNGLARDGGLYVPAVWPTLSPETIAGFAGKFLLLWAGEIARQPADTFKDVDGRIMILRGKLPAEHHVPVQDGADGIRDRIVHVIPFDQYGE